MKGTHSPAGTNFVCDKHHVKKRIIGYVFCKIGVPFSSETKPQVLLIATLRS